MLDLAPGGAPLLVGVEVVEQALPVTGLPVPDPGVETGGVAAEGTASVGGRDHVFAVPAHGGGERGDRGLSDGFPPVFDRRGISGGFSRRLFGGFPGCLFGGGDHPKDHHDGDHDDETDDEC
nr:hypothetical protein [Streptomyces rapamycinicus]